MLKSKIEVREFAVNKAVEVIGKGAPVRDVVEKAKEIEKYVLGEADLPEVYDENAMLGTVIGSVAPAVTSWMKETAMADLNTSKK